MALTSFEVPKRELCFKVLKRGGSHLCRTSWVFGHNSSSVEVERHVMVGVIASARKRKTLFLKAKIIGEAKN